MGVGHNIKYNEYTFSKLYEHVYGVRVIEYAVFVLPLSVPRKSLNNVIVVEKKNFHHSSFNIVF